MPSKYILKWLQDKRPFHSKVHKANQQSLEHLHQSLKRSQHLEQEFERCFANGGRHTEELVETCQKIICEVEKLLAMAIGKGEGQDEIEDAIETVRTPLEFLQQYGEKIHHHIESLDLYDGMLAPLGHLEKDLQDTFSPLKFIQTLFKVESASLPEENQTIFRTLTEQIEGLHTQVNELFNVKFRSLKSVQGTVQSIEQRLSTEVSRQLSTARDKRQSIHDAIQSLEHELNINSQRNTNIHLISQKMARHVDGLVTAMQTQDISGQKLSHVFEALNSSLQYQGHGTSTKERALAGLAEVSHNSALQVEHVNRIQRDFFEAQKNIIRISEEIFNTIKLLDDESLSLSDFKVLTTDANGVVQNLINAIDDVTRLVNAAAVESESAYEATKPLQGMTSDMTYMMRDLAISLRLVALNAQIQAAKLGEGTGLEVLAANVGRIADSAEELSNRAGIELDQLSEGFTGMVKQFSTIRDEAHRQGLQLQQKGETCKTSLHAFRDKAINSVQVIGELVSDMEGETHKLQRTFQGMSRQIDQLGSLAQTLQQINSITTGHAHEWQHHSHHTTERLRKNYTMEAEHDVHDAVFNNSKPTPSKPSPSSRFENNNVEFFHAPERLTPAPHLPQPTQAHDSNKGFFSTDSFDPAPVDLDRIAPTTPTQNDQEPSAQDTQKRMQELKKDQDDNIEFF